jgi:hypothetical protein
MGDLIEWTEDKYGLLQSRPCYYFPGGKAAGAWSWKLTFIYNRGQEWWNNTSGPPHVFMD